MNDRQRVPRGNLPLAHCFKIAFCGDPKYGLHLIPCDSDDREICEIVMSAAQTLDLINVCKDNLYAKVVERDKE
jgi:hypothetical protein